MRLVGLRIELRYELAKRQPDRRAHASLQLPEVRNGSREHCASTGQSALLQLLGPERKPRRRGEQEQVGHHVPLQVGCLPQLKEFRKVCLFLPLAEHALGLIDSHVQGVLRPGGCLEQQGGVSAKGTLLALPAVRLSPRLLVAGELVAIR